MLLEGEKLWIPQHMKCQPCVFFAYSMASRLTYHTHTHTQCDTAQVTCFEECLFSLCTAATSMSANIKADYSCTAMLSECQNKTSVTTEHKMSLATTFYTHQLSVCHSLPFTSHMKYIPTLDSSNTVLVWLSVKHVTTPSAGLRATGCYDNNKLTLWQQQTRTVTTTNSHYHNNKLTLWQQQTHTITTTNSHYHNNKLALSQQQTHTITTTNSHYHNNKLTLSQQQTRTITTTNSHYDNNKLTLSQQQTRTMTTTNSHYHNNKLALWQQQTHTMTTTNSHYHNNKLALSQQQTRTMTTTNSHCHNSQLTSADVSSPFTNPLHLLHLT